MSTNGGATAGESLAVENCVICGKTTRKQCGHCKKTYYCSRDCQILHRKEHKEDCFPLEFATPSGENRPYFVATRDIKAGETLFLDTPLVVGPSCDLPSHFPSCEDSEDTFFPICLSCNKRMKYSHFDGFYRKCIKCGWSLCSQECENNLVHADAECKIFSASRTQPIDHVLEYKCILLLRTLLLKEREPRKWKQMCSIPAPELNKSNSDLKNVTRFIRIIWGLSHFEENTIRHLLGIYTAKVSTPVSRTERIWWPVYMEYKKNFLAHSCVPNSVGKVLNKSTTGKNSWIHEYIAVSNITKGDTITAFDTVDAIQMPTRLRRRFVNRVQNFICKCERCSDPTELGSFFSAIKCPSKPAPIKDQCFGFLLPKNPLEDNSIWECNSPSCKMTMNYLNIELMLHNIELTTSKLKKEMLKKLDSECHHNDNQMIFGAENFELIERTAKVIEQVEKESLHPNHHLLFSLKEDFMTFLSVIFNNPSIVMPDPEKRRKVLQLTKKTAQSCLDVNKIISPIYPSRIEGAMGIISLCKWYLVEYTLQKADMASADKMEWLFGCFNKITEQTAALDILPKLEEKFLKAKTRNPTNTGYPDCHQITLKLLQKCRTITKLIQDQLFNEGTYLDYDGDELKNLLPLQLTMHGKPAANKADGKTAMTLLIKALWNCRPDQQKVISIDLSTLQM